MQKIGTNKAEICLGTGSLASGVKNEFTKLANRGSRTTLLGHSLTKTRSLALARQVLVTGGNLTNCLSHPIFSSLILVFIDGSIFIQTN